MYYFLPVRAIHKVNLVNSSQLRERVIEIGLLTDITNLYQKRDRCNPLRACKTKGSTENSVKRKIVYIVLVAKRDKFKELEISYNRPLMEEK
jgi:hypothetical protein